MALMFVVIAALAVFAAPADSLQAGFQNPPLSARPHTWWHWMNGNVTKAGITADLEAMKEVGIGGAQMFTVDQGIPAGPAGYNSKLWRDLTAFAVSEANRLGIELCIHNCAGWSSSGGPWIQPADAMQVLGWSTRVVSGGHIDTALDPIRAPQVVARVDYSKDIAVYAIPGSQALNPVDLGRTGVVRADGIVPDLGEKSGIAKGAILNLTSQFKDGRLVADLPAGDWTILRLGSVPTGKDNHPAPPEGDGLEVDKLSRAALDKHWDGMMAKIIAQVGPLAGKSLNNSLIDSYEVGSQNWTPKFREDFRRLRGYDPLPFMPALAGVTIESGPTTERFLWDYRRTIADLYAENYFGYFGELCHKKGLLFSTEPYGNGGFDNIQAGGTSDIPMGEFWLGGAAMESTKLASSIAHVYGRQIVGAESFTADDVRGKFLEEPYMMKTVGDLAWINGVNRYIFHRYAQQPWTNLRPGMTMGPWGTHLERTQTWWKEAATWLKYVARSQYLLQSGRFVADAVAYTGETAPVDLPYGRGAGRLVPEGYDYDGCDTRILMAIKVSNGSVVVPSGLKYRVLLLPPTTFMTPKVARKIRSLVADGATVVGPRPLHSPSLTGFPASETEIDKIGREVWGAGPVNSFGKGKVYSKATAGEVLRDLKIAPDFSYTGKARLLHLHRTIGDAEVYFVSNQRYQAATAECTFRVAGKQPELWHPETGKTEFAPIWSGGQGSTRVTLRLQPAESVFVVFRGKPTQPHLTSFSSGAVAQAKGHDIKVVSARYETADGRGVDVASKVRDLLSHGETEIEVTNSNFGDPVVNVVKRLNIEYTVDGIARRATVGENETLSIGPSGPVGSVNDAEIKVRPGGLSFIAWEKGKWSLASAEVTSSGPTVMDLSTDWKATFAPNLGAPPAATFPKLASWTTHKDPGVRYYSGSAVYSKSFSVAKVGQRVRLDLGDVKNFATAKLNGKDLGTLWKPPFVMDVTGAIQKGTNRLEVKVTNLWVNRLIGDDQLPPDVEWNGVQLKSWPEWLTKNQPRPKTGRIGFVTWRFWTKESPLLDSGLLGPVRLLSASEVNLRGHN